MSRWEAYSSAKDSTINKIESSLKLKQLTSSLPNAIAKDKKFCEKMHRTLIDSLTSSIREFSEEVEEQVKLKPGLDRLDKIAEDHQNQSEERPAWRTDRIPINNQVR